jgi:hypothetical protein
VLTNIGPVEKTSIHGTLILAIFGLQMANPMRVTDEGSGCSTEQDGLVGWAGPGSGGGKWSSGDDSLAFQDGYEAIRSLRGKFLDCS